MGTKITCDGSCRNPPCDTLSYTSMCKRAVVVRLPPAPGACPTHSWLPRRTQTTGGNHLIQLMSPLAIKF